MERRVLVLLCLFATIAFLFSSCAFLGDLDNSGQTDIDNNEGNGENEGNNTPCEHTFSDKWSYNSLEHWHAPTCEHTSLKADVDSHSDTDEDGKCDVCAYEVGHSHTYRDDWNFDATHHWREATCSHTGESTDLAPHLDTDSDGSCDSCKAHVHVVDIFGRCTVCAEKVCDVDISNLDSIIPIVVSNSYKINGGTLNYNYYSSSALGYINNDMVLTYVLGNGASYYKAENQSENYGNQVSSTQESWYQLLDDGSVFGVYRQTSEGEEGSIVFDAASNQNKLVGCYYSVSTLANAYGAENLLDVIYTLAKSKDASDFTSKYEDGKYLFAFNYLYVNLNTAVGEAPHVDYYEVKVSFTISDSGALSELNVLCDCYTNSLEDEVDKDFNYDPATGKITMRANARPDTYTFDVKQNEGVRNYVSEHPKSEFIPTDFDIYADVDRTEMINGTINVTVGKVFHLYLGNFKPEGTSISYVGDEFIAFCPYADVICFSNAITSSAIFNVKVAGTYTVTIIAGDVIKEVTVIAEEAETKPYDPTPTPENAIKVEITDNNSWVDYVTFTAPSDGDYTFTVPAGSYVGAWSDGEENPWADFNAIDKQTNLPKGGTNTVSLKKGETYKFYVSSPEKEIFVYIYYEITEYSGENGGNANPEVPTVNSITIGTHTLVLNDFDLEKEAIIYTLEVTEEGTYLFSADMMFANFYDSKNMLISRDSAYLTPGTYTISVYIGGLSDAGEYTFTISYRAAGGSSDTTDPEPDPDPSPTLTGLEGNFNTLNAYNTNVRVLIDSTSINIVDPEGRVTTFTYTYVDGVFEVYYKGNKLPNTSDPKFTITDGTMSAIYNNGTYYTLVPTDEDIIIEDGKNQTPDVEPDGTEKNPYILESLPESITLYSNTSSKVFYKFTAEKTGTFTITWPSADSWGNIFELNDRGENTGINASAYLTETISLEVTEGMTYRFSIGTWNTPGNITITLSID